MNKPLEKFYYGIVTDTKGVKKYLGRDDNSGGYPYITTSPTIHFDTKYLEAHKNDSYLNQIVDGHSDGSGFTDAIGVEPVQAIDWSHDWEGDYMSYDCLKDWADKEGKIPKTLYRIH